MRDQWGRTSWPIVVRAMWFALGFAFGMILRPAFAHDHGRPDLTDWYKALRTDSGPCCDGSDSKAIEDPDWESRGGHYWVRIDGNWVEVPQGAVLPGPNLDGRALAWPYTSGGVVTVRCFMRGREM